MLVRRVPAWSPWSKQEYGSSSAPSWSSPAWWKPTATPSTGWEWKPTQTPQASSAWSYPAATTPYGSYSIAPTPTPTASSQALSAPTPTTSDLSDILSSPTSLPDQTTSTNSDSPSSLGPSPSLTSAPFPNGSASQDQFLQRDPGKSNVVLSVMCVLYFIILAAAITAVYMLRKKKSQEGDLQTNSRKLTKKASPASVRSCDDESFRGCRASSFMVATPAIPNQYGILSTREILPSCPKGKQHSVSTQGHPVTVTHSNSIGKASSRSCDSTSTMLDPFMCYNYPLQAQQYPVAHRQVLRSPPAARSYSPKLQKNPFNSIKSSFALSRNERSPTNSPSNSSCLSSTLHQETHFNSLKSSSTTHRQEQNAVDSMTTSFYCQKSQLDNDYPCGSRDATKLRKTPKSRVSSATGVTSPSTLIGGYSTSNTLLPDMPSYVATLGRSEKTASFRTTNTTGSGLTSFLDNYTYDRDEVPEVPPRRMVKSSNRTASAMAPLVSYSASEALSQSCPAGNLEVHIFPPDTPH